MMNDHDIYLINAGLDGELEAGERAELEQLLSASAEARKLQAELMGLAAAIAELPEQDCPGTMTQSILGEVRLPAPRRRVSLQRLFEGWRPAPLGVAFAAGLLVALSYYELSGHERPQTDVSNLVGTMVSAPSMSAGESLDRLSIVAPGVNGQAELSRAGSLLVLSFDLESLGEAEIDVALSGAGLGFGGVARSGEVPDQGSQSYEISDGALRVVSQGRQVFSVFLLEAAGGRGSDRNILVGVSTDGKRVFDGALRG